VEVFRAIRDWRFTGIQWFRRYQYQACASNAETNVPLRYSVYQSPLKLRINFGAIAKS